MNAPPPFNVAGASKSAPIEEMSEGDWDFTVDLVLKGIFLSVKHEARAMSGGGAIVNVASLNAHVPMWLGAAYVAGKAGAEGFTKNAALELGGKGIRVNAILPGLVTTPLSRLHHRHLARGRRRLGDHRLPRPQQAHELTVASPRPSVPRPSMSYRHGGSITFGSQPL
ncbi:SDR family NAD(P)-dependent oxidoreductase [Brevibacterium jeotgali]|uniref:Short chain dehydrogenase n=1 Tax=Brevibacterium jeotgali TaxID=1262550 RepID=A0A2H1L2U0_9MICO|nr:SDR family NAD(P)-dependent oxidoreductase [Brevibacterium jeotgali]SMY11120.1 short chain dehydrogenase [Brevibacterium jeotgali]